MSQFLGHFTQKEIYKVIESSDDGHRVRDIVSSVIHLKSVNRQEFLYPIDTIYEFNNLEVLVSYPCYKPEVFTRIFFDKQSFYDSKTERITERIKSPIRQQDQYLLPFSAEAIDELFSDTIKNNTPQIYIRRNREGKTITKPCNFKDELSGVTIAVEWDNTNRTLEFFKTKSFDYLFNTQYIPEPIKAEMRARSEGIIREKVQLSPKIPADNFTAANDKDYSAYQ